MALSAVGTDAVPAALKPCVAAPHTSVALRPCLAAHFGALVATAAPPAVNRSVPSQMQTAALPCRRLLLSGRTGCGKRWAAERAALDAVLELVPVSLVDVATHTYAAPVAVTGADEADGVTLFGWDRYFRCPAGAQRVVLLPRLDAMFPAAHAASSPATSRDPAGSSEDPGPPRGLSSGSAVGAGCGEATLLLAHLAAWLLALPGNVLVVATATAGDAVHPFLLRLFDATLSVAPPGAPERAAVVASMFPRLPPAVSRVALDATAFALAHRWGGRSLAEVRDAALAVTRVVGPAPGLEAGASDLAASWLTAVQSAAARLRLAPPAGATAEDVATAPEVAATPWDAVAGLTGAKRALRAVISASHRRLAAFGAAGLPPPGGVVLYGVPGTGKTLLAKALATELHAAFMALDIASLVRSEVGESERVLRETFAAARRRAPAVLFLDEAQAAFVRRDGFAAAGGGRQPVPSAKAALAARAAEHASGAATTFGGGPATGGGGGVRTASVHEARLLSALLFELDRCRMDRAAAAVACASARSAGGGGAEGTVGVIVVAATNVPEKLDPAMLCFGRLDRHVLVPPPDPSTALGLVRGVLVGDWGWTEGPGTVGAAVLAALEPMVASNGLLASGAAPAAGAAKVFTGADLKAALNLVALELMDDGGAAPHASSLAKACNAPVGAAGARMAVAIGALCRVKPSADVARCATLAEWAGSARRGEL